MLVSFHESAFPLQPSSLCVESCAALRPREPGVWLIVCQVLHHHDGSNAASVMLKADRGTESRRDEGSDGVRKAMG